MLPWHDIPWVLAGVAAAGGLTYLLRRRRKSADEVERERQQWINSIGRITDGTLVDVCVDVASQRRSCSEVLQQAGRAEAEAIADLASALEEALRRVVGRAIQHGTTTRAWSARRELADDQDSEIVHAARRAFAQRAGAGNKKISRDDAVADRGVVSIDGGRASGRFARRAATFGRRRCAVSAARPQALRRVTGLPFDKRLWTDREHYIHL